jgi:CTP:molybdopterin cytidylyltransferase MocA
LGEVALSSSTCTAVSIIVINHNYAGYVGEAIESALAQTHDRVEVIVVDDGSTDNSRAVIEGYRGRIVPVLKANGGQASAFNAGFQHVSGSVVIFLDADDVLERGVAARVAAAFAGQPELAKVHYRLEVIDATGRHSGGLSPPAALRLPVGDLRELLRLYPDDVPYPPASGNAFASWALRRVLPMPEEEFRILADVYLLNLVPLLGPVGALDVPGGNYRVHQSNRHHTSGLRLDRVRASLRSMHATHRQMKRMADSLGLVGFPEPEQDDRSLVFLTQRLVSRKLEPPMHPFPADSPSRLAVRGTAATLGRQDLSLGLRLLYVAWFLAIASAPRRQAAWLAEQMVTPGRRGRLTGLVEWLRRTR